MKLVADSGVWHMGPPIAPIPLVAVLEVSGAVLSWTVDDGAGVAATHIALTDASRADWLWRIVGPAGHVELIEVVRGHAAEGQRIVELAGVDWVPGSVEPLRRLAIGHWLRRWWPASQRDGIAALDHSVLDAELAVLTAASEDFFTDDTLDSDVGSLIGPHAVALAQSLHSADRRIVALARAGTELANGAGLEAWGRLETSAPLGRRDDYALAAGPARESPPSGVIARGVGSATWAGVQPGIFDAAEDVVEWSIEIAGSRAVAIVSAAVIGPRSADGVAVRLTSGAVSGEGSLDAAGRATLALLDCREPMTETAAWHHDWRDTIAIIGADIDESPQTRERVRRFARARLRQPGSDAFLAEILAAESDY